MNSVEHKSTFQRPGKYLVSWSCQKSLLIFLLTTAAFALFPFLLLIFCFIWLIRTLLTWWMKTSGSFSDYGPFLSDMDALFVTASCPYSKSPLHASISNYMVLEGRLELGQFQRRVESRWPQILEGKNRRRLTQYLTTFLGFFLYRDEPNFKVEDHVRLLDIKELNERVHRQCEGGSRKLPRVEKKLHKDRWAAEELAQFVNDLTPMPFEGKKSPWEILLLHNPDLNTEPEAEAESESKAGISKLGKNQKWTTVLILRIHHSLADGVALFSFMAQILDHSQNEAMGKTLETFSRVQSQPSWAFWALFTHSVGRALRGIPEFVSHQVRIWPPCRRPFVQDCASDMWAFPFDVPLGQIKDIRQRNKGVSTTSVLMTAFALALDQYKKSKPKSDIAVQLPSNLCVATVSAGPRERNEFTNFFLLSPMRITAETTTPEGNPVQDSNQLLHKINREYLRIVSLPVAKVNHYIERWYGLMPQFLISRKLITVYVDGFFTNVPNFERRVSILGHPLLSSRGVTYVPSTAEFAVVALGYHDKLCFHVQLDKRTFKSQDEARMLIKFFDQQLCKI